ncbi:MAG: PLP-dependent aminotransferase family protein [Candidatus Obscuribacterales bacterium]|nr:PLP-dependent aminotransferase family protein [Candidatus Obscuribacterales bacterium]
MVDWLDILSPALKARDRRYPVYARIKDRIRESILNGQLRDRERLPADRELATILELDRSTVARAYAELAAEGLVESSVGRGTFVTRTESSMDSVPRTDRADLAGTSQLRRQDRTPTSTSPIIWHEKFSRFSESVSGFIGKQPLAGPGARQCISFAAGVPSLEFFPQADFESIFADFSRSPECRRMFAYTSAEGEESLRAEILNHLRNQGMSVDEDELIVLSGSQQGIDLVARTFLDPGDSVAIEDPSYFWATCNFTAFGARMLPVPVSETGINLDFLEAALSRRRVKILYIMPSFQNPTGSTMPAEQRKELLSIAARYQVAVFEDNFVGDLSYDGSALPPLRSHPGSRDLVIHQSTLSKSLCPGLRIGWMVAPAEAMKRLLQSKRVSDLSTNSISQVIVAEYLRRGLYKEHLTGLRTAYAQRRDIMCAALESSFSSGELRWSKPAGGMFIWAALPSDCSARELLPYAETEGVLFSPGDLFFVGADRREFLRLSFVQSNEAEIEEGIHRLAIAVRTYLTSKRKRIPGEPSRRIGSPSVFV